MCRSWRATSTGCWCASWRPRPHCCRSLPAPPSSPHPPAQGGSAGTGCHTGPMRPPSLLLNTGLGQATAPWPLPAPLPLLPLLGLLVGMHPAPGASRVSLGPWVFPTGPHSCPLAFGAPVNWNKEFDPQDGARGTLWFDVTGRGLVAGADSTTLTPWMVGHFLPPPNLHPPAPRGAPNVTGMGTGTMLPV